MKEIPKRIHQIWLGGPMPAHLQAFCEGWRRLHPEWEYKLWTEDSFDVPALTNAQLYRDAKALAGDHANQLRADILRYELLLTLGGVYVDADMECLRPIDLLLEGVECFAAWESPNRWVNNAVMGSTPGHPFLRMLVERLDAHARAKAGPGVRPNRLSGPQYLTPLLEEFRRTDESDADVVVYPKGHFYPYLWSELQRGGEVFPDAYAIHHWFNARRRHNAPLQNVRTGAGDALLAQADQMGMAADEMSAALADLRGLMTHEACDVLRDLAAMVEPSRAIVEIGSYKGMSTCNLAVGAMRGMGAHVWAIDPWDLPGNVTGRHGFAARETREAFEAQLTAVGVRERVTAIQAFSSTAAAAWTGPPIGLLYVDGDHSREAVLTDFRCWRPHLAPGAVVVFDDWGTPKNPGVAGAVRHLRVRNELRVLQIAAERLAVCHVA